MENGTFTYPLPNNEPILQYAPGSKEKALLVEAIKQMKSETVEIPQYIGHETVYSGKKIAIAPPHEKSHLLGHFHEGDDADVRKAIDAALAAKKDWEALPWANKALIFLKAADLLATKYRPAIVAATLLGQGKNAYQAEIDAACELIDFIRFNVHFLGNIYQQQPLSPPGMHNRLEWRPLEGFVLAVSPFNFTAIGGNLAISPALCGNTVVWKPAYPQVYSANIIMKVLKEAGLPDGVINLIYIDGPVLGEVCFSHKLFAGVHFTGSTTVFNTIWKTIGNNIANYNTYPKIVGETGGKDFVLVHKSADIDVAVTALVRGAFEYQGQKCSAASRAYLPGNLSDSIKEKLKSKLVEIKTGSPEDFGNFVNAVIDKRAFDKIVGYIEFVKSSEDATIIAGGKYDDSIGYFIEPTVVETSDPRFRTMQEEIFGPVLTIFTYPTEAFEDALELVDTTSPYALTGAVISQDRYALELALEKLKNAAGNFYVNDKPTGAVVGQQPFGGARASGTNDKAGSMLNLYRWLSPRTVKEVLVPVTDYTYPFLVH